MTETARQESSACDGADRSPALRTECPFCGYQVDPDDASAFAKFPCHVRAFVGQTFRIWRCKTCRTIHCLDVVNLDHYYAKYPFSEAKLDFVWRVFYRNLSRRFVRHGFTPEDSMLDYGCANGLFPMYLRGRGFTHCQGYDPYRPADGLGDPAILEKGPFKYILLQDVIEHVENPQDLLRQMDEYLAPGGHIHVGSPNADKLDLSQPQTFKNEVHAPYHLHILTREVLEKLGREVGWTPVQFYDRSYHDRPWFALNTRAAKYYQGLCDGSFDAFFDPFDAGRAFRSPGFWFYAVCGYWMSYRSDLSIMFRKSA